MRTYVVGYARHRPVRAAAMSLVLVAAVLAGATYAVDLTRWWLFNQQLEVLAFSPATGTPEVREWSVSYRHALYRFRVRVYPSELEAGRRLNTAWVFESRPDVRERYVRSLVAAESKSRLAAELVGQLRAIAKRRSLDDDEYAELLVRAVQDLDYGTIGTEISLPAEVVAGGQGVCTEKSVLLASLLVREGYDTALFVLDSHDHVAVGVRSDGPRFRDIPYAFVETTRTARIGEVRPDYLGWGPVGRRPQTIPLGGTKRYRGVGPRAGGALISTG